jgi:2-polyprenyl-3-methyl-5-hydroxy-6-metoxy-1,4-benzoquinol methylase
MKFTDNKDIKITLLNLKAVETHYPNFVSVSGDARNMIEFKDSEFDVVFSNSVIEHVGGYGEQRKMANEIIRVGKRYFLQTPNYYFPFEPHFLFPFFQFFPNDLKTNLVLRMNLGWHVKKPSRKEAEDEINSIRLLRKSELNELFQEAKIYNERILGMTIFFIVYNGWEQSRPK